MNKPMLFWHKKSDVNHLASILKDHKIVVGTSDTVLGLLAIADSAGAQALDCIKNRSSKPYIVLIGNKKLFEHYTSRASDSCRILIDSCWPGPLTVIVPAMHDTQLPCVSGTIAVRVPRHNGLLTLLKEIPALYSTSANKAGQPIPLSHEDIAPEIISNCEAIIIDDNDTLMQKQSFPSTIIDCTNETPVLVREGAYSCQYLESLLGYQLLRR